MRPALDLLDAEITRVIKRGLAFGLHKRELIENRVTVARAVEQQLGARIEGDQEILVRVVTGLDELRQRVARAFHLFAAHRTGDVENHADGNGRIIVAKKGDLLLLLVVENGKCAFAQAGDVTSIGVGDGDGERDQIGVGNQRPIVELAAEFFRGTGRLLRRLRWLGRRLRRSCRRGLVLARFLTTYRQRKSKRNEKRYRSRRDLGGVTSR